MNCKKTNRYIFPFLIIGLMFLCLFSFQGCEKDNDECTCDTCGSDTNNMVRKPNIYLYPTENTSLTVTLNFPMGGEIVTSIPVYNSGWNFFVDTAGRIDNTFDYLFYESIQPDIWQMEEGWTIIKSDLESFFAQNLSEYGFYGREITDFTEYWIARLTKYKYYEIYPQEADLINAVIQLQIINPPDNVLRLFYVIRGVTKYNALNAPVVNGNSVRSGFFVAEWGVILR